MDLSYLCVLIAAIFPYLLVGYAKFSGRGYNNASPREYLEHLDGPGKRAHFAHLNSFEAFPAFAAGVIIAHLSGAREETINLLAVLFITFRILYSICYISNQATVRSLVWFGGFACVIGLFLLSILK